MLLFSILGGVVLLLVLLLFVPTLLGVDYLHNNGVQKLRIRCRLLGIPFSIWIPLEKKPKKKSDKKQMAVEKQEKKSLTPKKFITFSKELYRGYCEVREDFHALLGELKKRFSCHELYFTIFYGTKNPATTGILNGAVWTAGSLLMKIADTSLGVRKKTLKVQPDFTQACMEIHIKATFCFKLFDAIRFVLKIIRLVNIMKSHISSTKEAMTEV